MSILEEKIIREKGIDLTLLRDSSYKKLKELYGISETTVHKLKKKYFPDHIRTYTKPIVSAKKKTKITQERKEELNKDRNTKIRNQDSQNLEILKSGLIKKELLVDDGETNSEFKDLSTETLRWNGERVTIDDIRIGALLYPEKIEKPKTRRECEKGERPCRFISCRYNLYLEVTNGNVKTLPWDIKDLKESCALDVAAKGDQTLEFIAELLDLTRERVRQIEEKAFTKLRKGKVHLPILLDYLKET